MRDDALDAIAAAIADGTAVPWESARAAARTAADRAVLDELRLIADLAQLHAAAGAARDLVPGDEWGGLRLVERVGHGAFGDVYRAWDPRLDREVALKLVSDGGANAHGGAVAEGRLLAKVRHPHVVAVHGAERIDERTGIWMEFIQGRTLQEVVADAGPLSAREAAGIGIDLCRALSAVHAAGLLHRDIKAQNVMRERGGRIVLMDLGAGREAAGNSGSDAAGTPLYQAPEILGGGDASPRSDIYSLGVLLFYLLTGEFPISDRTVRDVAAAHEGGQRRLLRDVRPDLPDGIVDVVERALAPAPEQRYASAGAMERALSGGAATPGRRLLVPAALAAILLIAVSAGAAWRLLRDRPAPSAPPAMAAIAVLPILNAAAASPEDYLADGLTEAIIADLSRVPGLRTISRTSSMYFKTAPRPVADIARLLGVPAVVEGTLRLDGDRAGLDVRLIDPQTDATVWSTSREGRRAELPALRRSVSTALAERLGYVMRPARERTPAPEAYDLYLRGRHQLNKRTPVAFVAAHALFTRALEADPGFGEAYSALAQAYTLLGAFSVRDKEDVFPKAEAAARRALEIDDSDATAHGVIGYVLWYRGSMQASHQQFRRALDLDPNHVTARQWYALTLLGQEAWDQAVEQMQIAHALDPLSMPVSSDLGVVYARSSRHVEAIAHLEKTIGAFPDFAEAHRQRALALEAVQRHADAASSMRRAIELGAESSENVATLGLNLARASDHAGAHAALARLDAMSRSEAVDPVHRATILAALANVPEATRTLRARRRDASAVELAVFVRTVPKRLPELWAYPPFREFARAAGIQGIDTPR